jgi:acetoin:2,6-dichlorophenolindophenol oxidoreductase subunit beta
MPERKYWQAINQALAEELERDPTVFLLGEDIGTPGGPFGATRGLLDRFGAARVRDTPISEATIVGTALGAAMTGFRPVAEVMFFDFITLAMDQLVNQAAKIGYMSGGTFRAPMVVRTLCGAARSTGPQHAQSLESWLAHVPGLKVVWGSNPADARGLLKAAIRDDDPVIVIESLSLWSLKGTVSDDDGIVPIGEAVLARPGADATVVAWGSAVARAQQAAGQLEADGISAEVIDLRTISPLDSATILESVARTGRLVVVHDAAGPFGPGAEIAAIAASEGFDLLKGPVLRVTPPFAPVPFAPHLEQAFFPQPDDIAGAVRQLVEQRGRTGALLGGSS